MADVRDRMGFSGAEVDGVCRSGAEEGRVGVSGAAWRRAVLRAADWC